ncbi:MAG: thymidine phosphorylase [Fimbriimonadales bacterium]|nr:thymidine phosphorylase [Fimbriimonadales bacterium]
MREIIAKKRDGGVLTREEIERIVMGYVRGELPDYQVAAWLMACFLRGLNEQETLALTEIMAQSGEQLDLSSVPPPTLDKHSTGGVGDKTSLVVVPLLASAGVFLAKMSGRGLGFTGGTVDKLESIPGYRTALTAQEMIEQVRRIGCCLTGQSEQLVPADKKLYALRDATATIESIPLIASSIMSKKLAGGARHLLLDVKVGAGAFMTTLEEARALARTLVAIGRGAGRKVAALLTDMSQPLGYMVGNALEVREAIETLTPGGRAHPRFRELCLRLAALGLRLCRLEPDEDAGYQRAQHLLDSGAALAKFRQMVEAQGGDPRVVDNPAQLPSAPVIHEIAAPSNGFVQAVHPRMIALAAVQLGAGRQKKEDPIDHAVGIELFKSVGDPVAHGEPILRVHARTEASLKAVLPALQQAVAISPHPVEPMPIVLERLE